ncbi:hypothetical protein SMMN14_04661 [Sphaerulina musiva]
MADSKAWELGLERKVSAGTSWQRRLYPTLGTSGGYATLRGLFDLLDLTGSAAVRLGPPSSLAITRSIDSTLSTPGLAA